MSLNDVDFAYVRHLIRGRSGIVLGDDKHYLVKSRLAGLLRSERLDSLEALVRRLRTSSFGPLHGQVVDAMTTNETSFFRDRYPFDLLKRGIIPELIRARVAERRLRIWCAACSSGQEPYSVAMLLRENFPMLNGWSIEILGTDLSSDALSRANEGRYSQAEVNRGLPAAFLIKYFEQKGTHWQVKQEVRDMVKVGQHNLVERWPATLGWDVVFMRNVLMYFNTDTKKTILGKIRRLLKPDGYLFLGGAETTLNLDETFERVPHSRGGCYMLRVGGARAKAAFENRFQSCANIGVSRTGTPRWRLSSSSQP